MLTPQLAETEGWARNWRWPKFRREIIPLLARGDEQASLPLLLSNNQYADIRTEEEPEERIHDLSKVLHNLQRQARRPCARRVCLQTPPPELV